MEEAVVDDDLEEKNYWRQIRLEKMYQGLWLCQ